MWGRVDVYTPWEWWWKERQWKWHDDRERLQNQRRLPSLKIEDEEDAHEDELGSDFSDDCDMLAGERLPKQRPHGDERPEHNAEEHLVVKVPHQDEETVSVKEALKTLSAVGKENEEFLNKNAEILRLEERRSTPKRTVTTTEGSDQTHRKCIREKKWRDSKSSKAFEMIKIAKKKALFTKIKSDRGECITSRKRIVDVFGKFYKRFYEDNERWLRTWNEWWQKNI